MALKSAKNPKENFFLGFFEKTLWKKTLLTKIFLKFFKKL